MNLHKHWNIVRKRLRLIGLLMIVAAAISGVYTLQRPQVYRTATTLYLPPKAASALLPFDASPYARDGEGLTHIYAEYMSNRHFGEVLAHQMGDGTTASEALKAVSGQPVPDTPFFKITAVHTDPVQAQKLANTTARTLLDGVLARQQTVEERTAGADQLLALEQQRQRELQANLQDRLAYYDEQIASLNARIDDLLNGPRSEEQDQRTSALRRELVRYENLNADVLDSLTRLEVTMAGETDTSNATGASVVDEAPLPGSPLPRGIVSRLMLALAVSLGIGVGLAHLLEYVDYTVRTPEELDAVYGSGTLGVIGVLESQRRRNGGRGEIVVLTDPRSPTAEAFRQLRTNIQFVSPDEAVRSLVVTSAVPGEGKTLLAANLAVSLAQGDSRVILVDADLRRPRLHRVFGVPKEPGLTNLVIDSQADLKDYLRRTPVDNLWVLTGGTVPPDPAELLGSARVARLMTQLKEHADVVVYDTPPAMLTDALVLASRVDAVLHVVQAGVTRRELIVRCRTALERANARVLGPVLNCVRVSDLGYHRSYYDGSYGNGRDRDDETTVSSSRSVLRRLAAPFVRKGQSPSDVV